MQWHYTMHPCTNFKFKYFLFKKCLWLRCFIWDFKCLPECGAPTFSNDTQHSNIQHSNIQHNDTQHEELTSDTQHSNIQYNDTQHKELTL
jgi:hypothetical protein